MIFHIALETEWDSALQLGIYSPSSITNEGFIHCSTREQIVATANLFYYGRTDLILLQIDEIRLTAPLRYETPADDEAHASLRFPHIYGPLNLDAIMRAEPFRCADDGSFTLPPSFQDG